jgi:hypothetical protein
VDLKQRKLRVENLGITPTEYSLNKDRLAQIAAYLPGANKEESLIINRLGVKM